MSKSEHDSSGAPGTAQTSKAMAANQIRGIAGAPGLAIGELLVLGSERRISLRTIDASDVPVEVERFESAAQRATSQLKQLIERSNLSVSERSILEAYGLMINDPMLHEQVKAFIQDRRACAEWAVDAVVSRLAHGVRGATDRYLRERSRDIDAVGELLGEALRNPAEEPNPSSREAWVSHPGVLVAQHLSPAQAAALDVANVKAIVIVNGTATSHTAIIARALGLPAVVGCRQIVERSVGHRVAVVDGFKGMVTLSPTAEQLEEAEQRIAKRSKALSRARPKPEQGIAHTRCGAVVHLLANTEFTHEVKLALAEGAGGIGLFRSEFLCTSRRACPAEQEQFEIYRSVLEQAKGCPVTVRTFDLGGDKGFTTPQHAMKNPALGRRGIRWGLAELEPFEDQLRALLRASVYGRLQVMLPMVTTLSELRQAKVLFQQARAQLEADGHAVAATLPFGCMIEVPAAAIMADQLAQEADFLSIGTNDLVQYTCAVDRGDPMLADLNHLLQPAVLQLIRGVAEAGLRNGCPVSVCGAMASDPLAALVLVGLGVRSLSVEPSALRPLREALSRITVEQAAAAAELALGAGCGPEAEHLADSHLHSAVGDLLDF